MRTLSRLLSLAALLGASCGAAAQSTPGPMPGASEIPDRTIYAPAGHAIGQVAGVVLDAKDRVAYAVIVHDVDAGLEMRLTAVPWAVLLASRHGQRVVLEESRLGASPVVTRDELGAAKSAWRARADRYWRVRVRTADA
jgi:sporulation protein YlmC with PRC-barrel domain